MCAHQLQFIFDIEIQMYMYSMNEENGMLCINVGKLNTNAAVNLFQSLIRVRTGVTL